MSILLHQGLAAHKQSDFSKAEQLYRQHLASYPKDVDALQLLGTLYVGIEKYPEGITLLKTALEYRPNQIAILTNLAIAYKQSGNYDGALAVYSEMLTKDPDNKRHFLTYIDCLVAADKSELAMHWCDLGMQKFDEKNDFLQRIASVHLKQSHFDAAIETYQQQLDINPNNHVVLHNMAMSLRQNNQPDKALLIYQQLLSQKIDSYELFHNMGNALADLGKLDEAILFFEKTIDKNPQYVDAHINLNELLIEAGRESEFLTSYVKAINSFPFNQNLLEAYGKTLLRVKQYTKCEQIIGAALGNGIENPSLLILLAKAKQQTGDVSESLRLFEQAFTSTEVTTEQRLEYAQTLMEVDQVTNAEKLLSTVVKHSPENQFAWALLGVCWRLLGDPREKQLNDYENLVAEYDIELPDGFASIEDFCGQLDHFLTGLHASKNQPLEQTLTGGTQTRGNLFNRDETLIQALVVKLKTCIDDYVAKSLPFEYISKYNVHQPYEFSGSWSVRLRSEGHHTPHIHPMGWLSSAFYVALPSVMQTDTNEGAQGAFCLGTPNVKVSEPLLAQKVIIPKVGKLVLFRSYMWHGTNPFESTEYRTTVAFDVVKTNN